MKNDYYTISDKRRYYFHRSINQKLPDSQRKYARNKYEKFKNSEPFYYIPLHVPHHGQQSTTLRALLDKLLRKKHRFDFVSKDHPKTIQKRHKALDREINRLKSFRNKFRISYKEELVIKPNTKKSSYV
jgi:3-hydroxy-3-methylglutaryl CoA synthase